MSGYFQMARGWMENEFFSAEPFTDREAWIWIIEQAAWRPGKVRIKGTIIDLQRGDLSFSVRFLAEKWRWSKSRVDRFLKRLAAENMISTRSKNGTTAGHQAGQGQSVITICNYEKYQSPKDAQRDSTVPESGTTAGQQRDKEEEGNKGRKKKEEGYAFDGATIRLSHPDFERWQRAYSAIPDLFAELQSLDDWISHEPAEAQAKWFFCVSGALKNRNAEFVRASRQPVIGI
jgi:DNA-binding transcriptional MocR family regulator